MLQVARSGAIVSAKLDREFHSTEADACLVNASRVLRIDDVEGVGSARVVLDYLYGD